MLEPEASLAGFEVEIPDDLDLGNINLVSLSGEDIAILAQKPTMSRLEALVFAAWLVTMADDGEFEAIIDRVQEGAA